MYDTEWVEYYEYLEGLRQSGVTNMFGAAPFIQEAFGLNRNEARKVLASWMQNYELLIKDKIIRGD